ncbi:MAG: CDP-alcohol phosphatidyltransferase family protein [Bacteroidota bacterium]
MLKSLPNIFTASNLFCGMVALIFVATDNLIGASAMVATSLLMDWLDGFVARLVGVSSPVGKELDSLADMVTFGAVPGFVMAAMIQASVGKEFVPNVIWHPSVPEDLPYFLLGFFIPIFSALRLARFNLDERQSDAFYGLPTPANTMLIFSLWMISRWQPESWLGSALSNTWVLIGITLFSSYILIADIKLLALKFKSFGFKGNEMRYILITLSLLLIIALQYVAIPLVLLLYIILSLIDNARNKEG